MAKDGTHRGGRRLLAADPLSAKRTPAHLVL